jgi:hypothetical protein
MKAIPTLGDMEVAGLPPMKLVKALAVIATELHPTFARQLWIAHPDKSKESCVLSSLTVRDFLVSIGFRAQVRTVACVMRGLRDGKELHSLGIGIPGALDAGPLHWNGHMVATVGRFLIDTTLYPSVRPQWPDSPGMLTMPFTKPRNHLIYGLRPIAGAVMALPSGVTLEIIYLDNAADMSWMNGPDGYELWRRRVAVETMRARFGHWHAGAKKSPGKSRGAGCFV